MALETTPTHPQADSYVTLAEADAYLSNRTDVDNWNDLTDAQKEALLKLATKQIDSLRFFGEPIIPSPMYYRDMQSLKWPRKKEGGNRRNWAYYITGSPDSVTSTTLVDAGLADRSDMPDDFWKNGAVIITDGTGKGQTKKIDAFDSSTGTITVSGWDTQPDTTSNYLLVTAIPDAIKEATIEQALYLANGGGERARLQSEGVKSYSIGDLSETFGDDFVGKFGGIPLNSVSTGLMRGLVSKIGRLI